MKYIYLALLSLSFISSSQWPVGIRIMDLRLVRLLVLALELHLHLNTCICHLPNFSMLLNPKIRTLVPVMWLMSTNNGLVKL